MTADGSPTGGACPSCGEPVDAGDGFCESCGTELSPAMVSTGAPGYLAECPVCSVDPASPPGGITADGYCESCGRKVPSGRDHVEIDLGLLAGVTDRGLRHQRNEDAMALAAAHVITGWLGADLAKPQPHLKRFEPQGPGLVLVCSDGLWNYRPEAADLAELALPAALSDPLGTAGTLLKFALDAGGMDNITVVLAPFPLIRPQTLPRRPAQ